MIGEVTVAVKEKRTPSPYGEGAGGKVIKI